MPRIRASSVAEHVAEQEAAVFRAAIDLFVERGYENVSLSDIAGRIGLARNSLYRYFPDKAHILLRWFEQELPEQLERATTTLSGSGAPHDRITAWARDQIDYARRPEHGLVSKIGTLVPNLDPRARARLATAHQQMIKPLRDVLAEAGIPAEHQELVADLMQNLVIAAARHIDVTDNPATRRSELAYLDNALLALLQPTAEARLARTTHRQSGRRGT